MASYHGTENAAQIVYMPLVQALRKHEVFSIVFISAEGSGICILARINVNHVVTISHAAFDGDADSDGPVWTVLVDDEMFDQSGSLEDYVKGVTGMVLDAVDDLAERVNA